MKEDVTGIVSSSRHKNLKPFISLITKKIQQTSQVMNLCFFITVFGKKELQVLCQQFAGVLHHPGVASEQVQTQWVMLKSHLYNKWVF